MSIKLVPPILIAIFFLLPKGTFCQMVSRYAIDSADIRKHPPTPPVYYKEVKESKALAGEDHPLSRKYSESKNSPDFAPPTAPIKAESGKNLKDEGPEKAGRKNSQNKESFTDKDKLSAPVYQPKKN